MMTSIESFACLNSEINKQTHPFWALRKHAICFLMPPLFGKSTKKTVHFLGLCPADIHDFLGDIEVMSVETMGSQVFFEYSWNYI